MPELLELSRQADVEFARVVMLLERDTVVASQVLRKTQSAFYAAHRPIRTLHEAIVLSRRLRSRPCSQRF